MTLALESFWEIVSDRLSPEVNTQEPVGEPFEKLRYQVIGVIKSWAWANARKSMWKFTVVIIEPNTRFPLRHELMLELEDTEPTEFDVWEAAQNNGKAYALQMRNEFSLIEKLQHYDVKTGLWHDMPVPETWSPAGDDNSHISEAMHAYSQSAASAAGMHD